MYCNRVSLRLSSVLQVLFCCICFSWKQQLRDHADTRSVLRKWIAGTVIASSSLVSSFSPVHAADLISVTDSSVEMAFQKAAQMEKSGNFVDAQKAYEEIVGAAPDYVYGWANLGNVLTAQGDLSNALLCYKKALSLNPPTVSLPSILLNKAVVELNLGENQKAYDDMKRAERAGGLNNALSVNEAVALSKLERFQEATEIFDRIISSADRYALPWWLRYAVSLLETSRGMESVAMLQRVLNRYSTEPECNAFATSLYMNLGSKSDAVFYWRKLSVEDQKKYSDLSFLKSRLFWGPKSIQGIATFLNIS